MPHHPSRFAEPHKAHRLIRSLDLQAAQLRREADASVANAAGAVILVAEAARYHRLRFEMERMLPTGATREDLQRILDRVIDSEET